MLAQWAFAKTPQAHMNSLSEICLKRIEMGQFLINANIHVRLYKAGGIFLTLYDSEAQVDCKICLKSTGCRLHEFLVFLVCFV